MRWICLPDKVLLKEQDLNYGIKCHGKWIWPCAYVRGHLSREFKVSKGITKAYAYFECDNKFDLFINQEMIELTNDKYIFTNFLQEGDNIAHLRVYQSNSPDQFTSAIRGEIHLIYKNLREEVIYTDASWVAYRVGNFYEQSEPKDWLSCRDFPKSKMICEKVHPVLLRHSCYFKRNFHVQKSLRSAILYASARGLYKAFVNGVAVSTDKMSPGAMEKIQEFQEYDIFQLLHCGENVLGFITGNGWYNCKSWGELTAKKNMVWFELELMYSDGSIETICSDHLCQAAFSPIIDNDLQFGERYDARREILGWCEPNSKNGKWYPVEVIEEKNNSLCKQTYPPIRPIKYLTPVNKKQIGDKCFLFDYGINISGRVHLKILNGKSGNRIVIRYYERFYPETTLCDGPYLPVYYPEDTSNGNASWSVRNLDVYLCKNANVQTYESEFTYTGFRYIMVQGLENVDSDTVYAVVMNQDLKEVGEILTAYTPIMQLWEMIKRSYRSNILGGPTDCPTREKNFWNGDIQTYAPSACWYMDNSKFLSVWSASGRKIEYGVYGWEDEEYILPWTLYCFYGNREVLESKYPSILQLAKRRKNDVVNGLTQKAHAPYRDHLSTVNVPEDFFADCYYCLMLQRISQIAEVLGDNVTANAFKKKRKISEQAFHEKYYLEDVEDYSPQCQSGLVLPLAFDLTPKECRSTVVKKLNDYLVNNDYHITTGYMATPFLLGILCDYKYKDTVWRIINQTEYPSWRYLIQTGATTMTENWEGISTKDPYASMNHYGFGSVSRFFFESLGGIRVFDGEPGFSKIVIKPIIIPELGEFEVKYKIITGTIRVYWKIKNVFAKIQVEIPKDSTAIILLPNGNRKRISGGKFEFCNIKY